MTKALLSVFMLAIVSATSFGFAADQAPNCHIGLTGKVASWDDRSTFGTAESSVEIAVDTSADVNECITLGINKGLVQVGTQVKTGHKGSYSTFMRGELISHLDDEIIDVTHASFRFVNNSYVVEGKILPRKK